MSDQDKVDAEEQPIDPQDESTQEREVSMESLMGRIDELENKAQENWDQFVRSKAELDNVRRRAERDLENAHKYSLERFAQELLPIKDSLEMGVAAAQDEAADVAKLREGSELTLKMLSSTMEKFGIQVLDPKDEPFNPEWHQAVTMIEAPGKDPNIVIDVMQRGYTLNERLIRPAMVVVSKASETDTKVDEQA